MLTFKGFETKRNAVAFTRAHNGLLAYKRDMFGRSENADHYNVAVTVGNLDSKLYPYCVYYEK